MYRIKSFTKAMPRVSVSLVLFLLNFLFKLLVLLFLFAILGVFFLKELALWNIIPILLTTGLIFFLDLRLARVRKKRKNGYEEEKKHTRLKLAILLLLIFALLTGFTWNANNANKFADATDDHKYSLTSWHLRTLSEEWADFLTFWNNGSSLSSKEESLLVIRHFDLAERQRALERRELRESITEEELEELESIRKETKKTLRQVEKILQKQIREVLISEEIINPFNRTSMFFPPVLFRIEEPPKLLVVSERDSISRINGGLIVSHVDLGDIEHVEKQVEEQGYSALIVNIGGMATFPNTVAPMSLHSAISTMAHEWVHLYATFRPLGRADVRLQSLALEEGVADIVGDEIRDIVWERYYAPHIEETETPTPEHSDDAINFQEEMRKTYERVEEYLEKGKVAEAELYMNERRDWFEENGYYIRKLNQAYFAFRGSYAARPEFQEAHGGMGAKLFELREISSSLKEFLELSTSIRTLEELDNLLNEKKAEHSSAFNIYNIIPIV